MKKITVHIIGAGPGGLAAAMILAARGFDVHVFEKEDRVGGRNARLEKDGFSFDIGPTFFILPAILQEIFLECGYEMNDFVRVKRLDPMYRLQFSDTALDMTQDREKMRQQIAAVFPGNEDSYDRFLQEEKKRFDKIFPLLQKSYIHPTDFLDRRVFSAIPSVSIGKNVIDVLSRYFTDEKLQLAFTFQAKYLGMSPWSAPGLFAILPYIEHAFGVYHVEGGLNRLSDAMAKVATELGAVIHFNTPVQEVLLENNSAVGVRTQEGEQRADEVIVNADFSYAATQLFPEKALKKWNKEKLAKTAYSCSTFMLYLGVDGSYDLPHNTIVFSKEYRAYVESLSEDGKLIDDISFYVCNPSAIDSSMAPEGKSSLYVLVPVPNNRSGIDWEKEAPIFRETVLSAMEKELGMKGIRERIETEHCITPRDWEVDFNVFVGAVFNIGHQILQMLYFRPRNQFEEIDHCYLVGGGTHPGSGLPTIYESGRMTANILSRKYGIPYTEPNSVATLDSYRPNML